MSTAYNARRGAKANKPRPPRMCEHFEPEGVACTRYALKSGRPLCDDHDGSKPAAEVAALEKGNEE